MRRLCLAGPSTRPPKTRRAAGESAARRGGGNRRSDRRLDRGGGLDAPCAGESPGPVGEAHVLGANALARSRRVDEAVVADVDADVRERSLQCIEEDEVARAE